MGKRKIERMRELFGSTSGEKCKTCCHLQGGVNEYRKCEVYGSSRSEATDWALSYEACGLWNKPFMGDRPVIKWAKDKSEEDQIEGQMSIEEVW